MAVSPYFPKAVRSESEFSIHGVRSVRDPYVAYRHDDGHYSYTPAHVETWCGRWLHGAPRRGDCVDCLECLNSTEAV